MASCASPITIDLSSDSEHETHQVAESCATLENNDVFILDWDEDNDIPPFDPQDMIRESPIEDQRDDSHSGSDTIIMTPEEIRRMTPNSESSPEKPKEIERPKNCKSASPKGKNKALQAEKKIERQRLREERKIKKAEEVKQKRIKAALALKQRILKPEENIKLLTVIIDTKIVNSEYGGKIITTLHESGLHYTVEDQEKPFTILWSKKIQDVVATDDGVVCEEVGDKKENQLLYLITGDKCVRLVAFNELLTHVETIKSIYLDKTITVVISGMQKYFNVQKKRLKNDNGSRSKRTIQTEDNIEITKEQLQTALIELQLLGKCKHWLIESPEELSSLVVSVTKSLSQLDFKSERHKNDDSELEWYAKADSKNCVKVDKNGEGLLKLWQQQLCQFGTIGPDIANAIASNFRSPQALLERYKNCGSADEARLALQNIQVRREAGILSATRRVGPEISKKLYHFFSSDNPDLEL